METVIKVEGLYKEYRLGAIGQSTIREDLNNFLRNISGKKATVDSIDDNNRLSGESKFVYALQNINFEVQSG